MKKRIRTFVSLVCAAALALSCAACGGTQQNAGPSGVTKITVWTYYNGDQLESFNQLVENFNETTGREKGILVESASQGSVNDLEANVMDAAQGKVGAAAMPNIFSAYADTAYALDQMGMVVDLNQYLTEEERAQYVQGYLTEGDFDGDGSMKIFPVAKSTELLFLNETDWEPFAAATGRFRSDDIKVGNVLAYVGSNSSATFFPTQVTVNDTTSYDIDMTVLPCPKFAGGEDVAVQQGAGMVVTTGTEDEIKASVEFLKWFTQPENNISFSVGSGYLPVTTAANDMAAIESSGLELSAKMEKILTEAVQNVKTNILYTPRAFADGTKARSTLEYSMSDLATADRATVLERVAEGQSAAEAEAEFLTDDYFEAWYQNICAALEEYVG